MEVAASKLEAAIGGGVIRGRPGIIDPGVLGKASMKMCSERGASGYSS